jgi:hypothetical protein
MLDRGTVSAAAAGADRLHMAGAPRSRTLAPPLGVVCVRGRRAERALQMTVQIEPRLVQGQHTRAGYFSLRLSTTTRTTTAAALTHILARSEESRELDAKINRAARAPLESLSLLGCLRAGRLCR